MTTSSPDRATDETSRSHDLHAYLRFGAMIATSTVVMFLLTSTNVIEFSHARFSEERVYMAILMGAAMAIVMLGFMWGQMYRDTRVNIGIVLVAVVVGVAALWLSRSQQFVEDPAYTWVG